MDGIAILLGFGLRLGLPIVVTALLAWWLKRLDARWQREARAARLVRPPATPCWEIRGCLPARRAHCPAYQQPDTPCWQVFRDGRGQLRETCLACPVFAAAPAPAAA